MHATRAVTWRLAAVLLFACCTTGGYESCDRGWPTPPVPSAPADAAPPDADCSCTDDGTPDDGPDPCPRECFIDAAP